jgi:hypothetical protein
MTILSIEAVHGENLHSRMPEKAVLASRNNPGISVNSAGTTGLDGEYRIGMERSTLPGKHGHYRTHDL